MYMTYETPRLVLCVLTEQFAGLSLQFYEENRHYFEHWEADRAANFYTLHYHQATMTYEYNEMVKGKHLRFWIFEKGHPDKIVGTVCFSNIKKGSFRSCEIGYKIAASHMRKGYAYESILSAVQILYSEMHTHRIEAYIHPHNIPSLRLAKKIGFLEEGIAHSSVLLRKTWTDHLRLALLTDSMFID